MGPENSRSRQLLQSMVDEIEGDATIVWGRSQNKLDQLMILKEANILVPRFSIDRQELMCTVEGDVWGRKINHSQGRDIKFPGDRGYERSDYYVEPIRDVKNEWRVHVFDGLSIHAQYKFRAEHSSDPKSTVIKSRRMGWRLRRDLELPPRVRAIAKNAVAALQWDLGAVDLLECNGGKIFVLEVNSRPGLDSRTTEQYVKAIRRKLNV